MNTIIIQYCTVKEFVVYKSSTVYIVMGSIFNIVLLVLLLHELIMTYLLQFLKGVSKAHIRRVGYIVSPLFEINSLFFLARNDNLYQSKKCFMQIHGSYYFWYKMSNYYVVMRISEIPVLTVNILYLPKSLPASFIFRTSN